MINKFYLGDNLTVLPTLEAESVDLCYIDPPFNIGKDFNDRDGKVQFTDRWRWDDATERIYRSLLLNYDSAPLAPTLQGIERMFGFRESSTFAYLVNITARLGEIHRVLKPTGTLFLHCDPTASHYLKIILDAVFCDGKFLNEIVWGYMWGMAAFNWFPRKHDTIFWYAKGKTWTYNIQREPYLMNSNHGLNSVQHPDGKMIRDIWDDIRGIVTTSHERTGYPTQKPIKLLERIILAASNPGDVVLDAFAGSGTTVVTAKALDRQWIAIDVNPESERIIKERMREYDEVYLFACEKT